MAAPEPREGWGWFDQPQPLGAAEPGSDLCRSFLACFSSTHGEVVLRHLRRVFLDRRLPPTASDAELRHVEGQRSVVAYVAAVIERARDGQQDRL